jgi:hypothetical protein
MKIIKVILILILLATTIGAGFYYATTHFPTEKFSKFSFGLQTLQKIQPAAGTAFASAGQAVKKGQEFSKVLGVQDAIDEVSKNRKEGVPLYQQTFERTRYTYCKQVITDYEARYSAPTPAPTETPHE